MATGCKFDGAYDLPLPGAKVDPDDAYAVQADFADALNVVPRTAVMVDDVVVGQVTDVTRVGWHARVSFLVRKDIKLPENVGVDVRQTSLLGEKYIALVEPAEGTASTKRLSDGDFIPLARTGRNPEVEEVLGALSMLLSGGGIGQLKTISVEMNKMLNGRTDEARNLLGNLDRLVGALDDQKDDIIAAMDSIDRLCATLVKEKDTIGDAIDAMGPALKVLNRQHKALIRMLRQLDELGRVGTRVLDASTENIVASPAPPAADADQARRRGRRAARGPLPDGQLPVPQGGRRHRQGRLRQRAVQDGHRPQPDREVARRRPARPDQPLRRRAPDQIGQLCAGLERRLQEADLRQPATPAAVLAAVCPDGGDRPADSPIPNPPRAAPAAPRRAAAAASAVSAASSAVVAAMTRGIKIRLLAFLLLSAVGVVYVAGSFLGLTDRLLGRGMTIHATLPTSGGLFTGSEVTSAA